MKSSAIYWDQWIVNNTSTHILKSSDEKQFIGALILAAVIVTKAVAAVETDAGTYLIMETDQLIESAQENGGSPDRSDEAAKDRMVRSAGVVAVSSVVAAAITP